MIIPPEAVGTMLDLDVLYGRPRPRRKKVLTRRLRKLRSAERPLTILTMPPKVHLSREEMGQLRAQFLKAQRTGTIVISHGMEIRRIR